MNAPYCYHVVLLLAKKDLSNPIYSLLTRLSMEGESQQGADQTTNLEDLQVLTRRLSVFVTNR